MKFNEQTQMKIQLKSSLRSVDIECWLNTNGIILIVLLNQ